MKLIRLGNKLGTRHIQYLQRTKNNTRNSTKGWTGETHQIRPDLSALVVTQTCVGLVQLIRLGRALVR